MNYKKIKIWASVFSLLFMHQAHLHGACAPIAASVNESLWMTLDTIKAVLCGPDSNVIFQTDVPVTITQAGVYCVAQNLTSMTSSPIISISNARDVVLRLNGYMLTKSVSTDGSSQAAIDISDTEHVRIFDGKIKLVDSMGASGDTHCIMADSFTGLTCRNISMLFDGNPSMVDTHGLTCTTGNTVFITECNALNLSQGFEFFQGSRAIFRRCQAVECDGGFQNNNASHIIFAECASQTCVQSGFFDQLTEDVVYQKCTAISCGTTGMNNNGFTFGSSGLPSTQVIVSECNAQNCGMSGISAAPGTSNVFCFRCTSVGNVSDGFSTAFTGASNNNFWQCKATANGNIGFNNSTGPATNFAFNCYAEDNGVANFSGLATPVKNLSSINDGSTNFWHNFTP